VIIDDELKWTEHVDNLYNKLIEYTSVFYSLCIKLPNSMLKDI